MYKNSFIYTYPYYKFYLYEAISVVSQNWKLNQAGEHVKNLEIGTHILGSYPYVWHGHPCTFFYWKYSPGA